MEQATNRCRKFQLAHLIVTRLMDGNNEKGHIVVIDNYFSSVELFEELARNGTYSSGTLRTNCIGILQILKNRKELNHSPQNKLVWKMHDSQGMASVNWKDKRPMILLSTHVLLLDMPKSYVPRRNGAIRELVHTSTMYLEYTTYMKRMNVVDQLIASYSGQTQLHKWWHRIFCFLLDTTIVNMYMYYLAILKEGRAK